MIIVECEQGSLEWHDARLGIPTSSNFHRIITPKTGKLSAGADGYMCELLAAEMLGHPLDESESQFMERGSALERSAIEFYEFNRDTETERVGVILSDDGMVGCSPDRVVGDDGGLEIKCPSAKVHVSYMLGQELDPYRCQVQGALWITGRPWWDWLSYNPELPPVLVRFERDEEFIAKLANAVTEFVGYLHEKRERLIRDGLMSPDMIAVRAARLERIGAKEPELPWGFGARVQVGGAARRVAL